MPFSPPSLSSLPALLLAGLALALLAADEAHAFSAARASARQDLKGIQFRGPFMRGARKRSSADSADSSSSSSKGFLQIAEAPPKLLEARQHGKTVLECSASGNPAPEITWFKDGKPLIKDYPHSKLVDGDYGDFSLESMSETKSKISLDCVSEDDAGLYECVAHSSSQKTSVGTEVHVVSSGFEGNGCIPRRLMNLKSSPPKIFQWMETYLQLIGTEAHLICRAEGAHQTAWIGPTGDIIDGEGGKFKVLSNGDLIIRELSFDDMGMFKCVVSNEHGEDMTETFVYPHTA